MSNGSFGPFDAVRRARGSPRVVRCAVSLVVALLRARRAAMTAHGGKNDAHRDTPWRTATTRDARLPDRRGGCC